MTVIFGANLSDRIYLAADSRLSEKVTSDTGEVEFRVKHDNMLKIDALGHGGILFACAGNAHFCKYFIKHLKQTKETFPNIQKLREGIEEWALPIVDSYYSEFPYVSATIMFAGADKDKNQIINGKDMMEVITAYTGGTGSGTLKKVLADGITAKGVGPNPEPELSIPSTELFAIEIDRTGIELTTTKWGEFLIYGPEGLDRSDVPKTMMGQLEFEGGGESFHEQFQHDVMMNTALIHTIAEEKQYDTVGGCYVVMSAFHDGSTFMMDGNIMIQDPKTKQIHFINGLKIEDDRIYRTDQKGTKYRLLKLIDYRGSGDNSLALENVL